MDNLQATATYSAEDNKLRLYFIARLSPDLFTRVKEAGFSWAPKQELFVAHRWTPARADFCIELAGLIEPEESTVLERAEAKADRLERIADNKTAKATAFFEASTRISERFAFGQPILVGHHSERKARNDQKKMHNAMNASLDHQNAASYFYTRATSVERHANQKHNVHTRINRIKVLLADLRKKQRTINEAQVFLTEWLKIEAMQGEAKHRAATIMSGFSGARCHKSDAWRKINDGEVTADRVIADAKAFQHQNINSTNTMRWILHILHRLNYESLELGGVERYNEDLTPVILQLFARTMGGEKPKVVATPNGFKLTSAVALPLHLADGDSLELSTDGWRALMLSCCYSVPPKVQRKESSLSSNAPLINLSESDAQKLQDFWNSSVNYERLGAPEISKISPLDQKTFSRNTGDYSPCSIIKICAAGKRIRQTYRSDGANPVFRVRIHRPNEMCGADRVVFLTDKPTKPLPIKLALDQGGIA